MRPLIVVALLAWILTGGSSCQTTSDSSGLRVESQNGATVALVAVFAAYCLLDREACGGGEPSVEQQLDAKFEESVRRFKEGDQTGLQRICWLAHAGYSKAQYFYGVHLFKVSPQDTTASVGWLERASAQGHKAADFMLEQIPRGKDAREDWEPESEDCGGEKLRVEY